MEQFESNEEARDHLGDLIHALRSHNPCTKLHRGDPLWCSKTSCVRPGILWCHMHGCSSEGDCLYPKCLYSRRVITHWMHCHNNECFVCGPWIRPTMLEDQPRKFLIEVFGTSSAVLIRGEQSKTSDDDLMEHLLSVKSSESNDSDDEDLEFLRLALEEINKDPKEAPQVKIKFQKHDSMDHILRPKKCTNSKKNAECMDPNCQRSFVSSKSDIYARVNRARRNKPGPSGYRGPYIRPVFMGSSCCEAV